MLPCKEDIVLARSTNPSLSDRLAAKVELLTFTFVTQALARLTYLISYMKKSFGRGKDKETQKCGSH